MVNLLNAKTHALLKGCLTIALLSLALLVGPVIFKPNVQANPGDKDKSQKPGGMTPANTGAITGNIIDSTTSFPLENIEVRIVNSSRDLVALVLTNSSGFYSISGGLGTGTYYAFTKNSSGYLDEVYNNINCLLCDPTMGTPIAVTDGATTTGIDFALATGGRISGTVTDAATSAPIADLFVQIYRGTDGQGLGSFVTDGSGNYISGPGLPTGTYYAVTQNTLGYVDEFYDNIVCFGCSVTSGTPIAVTVGATTSGINFALAVGGRISGTVTDERDGMPIANGFVQIHSSSGAFITSVQTDGSGNYQSLTGLPAGSYYVRTSIFGLGYRNELYNNIPCHPLCDVTTGTPVPVTPGATTTNINFALTGGGIITGRVTDPATNMPLANVEVHFFNSDETFGDIVMTDSSGNYSTPALPTGSYYVFTTSEIGYIDEVYNNIVCVRCDPTLGTLVPVTPGATVSNIDFALDRGGSISGDVMDGDFGIPIDLAIVDVFDVKGNAVAFGFPDSTGNYVITTGLPTGTYYARTRNVDGYIDELYKDMECVICDVTQGTPIEVIAGSTTTDIKFTLQKGGLISGLITNAATDESLFNSRVDVFDSSGRLVTSQSTFSFSGFYLTNVGLPTGIYFARSSNVSGLPDMIYDNITCPTCDPTIGTPINVVVRQTTNSIDFALCPSFSLSKSSALFGSSGGEGSLAVSSMGGCGWAAVSNVPWIVITSNQISPGDGPLTFLVRDNPGPMPRTGSITVANQSFTVTQEGQSAPGCTFTISPLFASFNSTGGASSINVTTQAGCAWNAESDSSWITFTSCCGTGNGQVNYTVAANQTGSGRKGVITIAGKKFNVKQK